MEMTHVLVEWRSIITASGEQCVMITGTSMMQRWCADRWGVAERSAPLTVPTLVREVTQYFWIMLVVLEVNALSLTALIMDLVNTAVVMVKMLVLSAQVRRTLFN